MNITREIRDIVVMWLSIGRGRRRSGGLGLFGRYSTVIVQSLCHQLHSKRIRHTARFLQLGTLVLEPDFDLRLVKTELCGEPLSTFFGEVATGVELSPQHGQLVSVERRPRSLVVWTAAAVDRRLAAGRRTIRHTALTAARFTRSRTYQPTVHGSVVTVLKLIVFYSQLWPSAKFTQYITCSHT